MKRLVKVWIVIQVLSIPLIALCFKIEADQSHKRYEQRTVAKVISAEACGEGAHGMLAVANTIQNRMERTGQTAFEVVTEPNQYHGLTSPTRDERYVECANIADNLSANIGKLQDLTDGAIYFNTCEPKSYHGEFTVKIKQHCFYKAKEK